MSNKGLADDFFSAIGEVERRFSVADWRINGMPAWPLVRIAGRSELLQAATAAAPAPATGRVRQLLQYAVSPACDPLKNIRDWKHERLRLPRVDALFLSDGISLDNIGGAWRDRYCTPLMEAFAGEGASSLLMTPSGSQMLPRQQPAWSAHWIDCWGRILARSFRDPAPELPGYVEVRDYLESRGFSFSLLELPVLTSVTARIAAMAHLMDFVLARTRPRVGLAVSYYWEIGYAFNLACRRRGILSVDIQHGAQDGRHEAYNLWEAVSPDGYAIMPAVFWNWSASDAAAINAWAGTLSAPWHRGFAGGHPQLASWLDGKSAQTRAFDAIVGEVKARHPGSFDILVALQDVEGYGDVWDRLAEVIASTPSTWRWWLRRHPSPAYNRGVGIRRLLSLNLPNVIVEEASSLPLPALLRQTDVVLSLMSGTAVEAVQFGHRPVFLTDDARGLFSAIFDSGSAMVITDMQALTRHLSASEAAGRQPFSADTAICLQRSVRDLMTIAEHYRQMVAV